MNDQPLALHLNSLIMKNEKTGVSEVLEFLDANWTRTQVIKRGEYLCIEGSYETRLFFIKSGTIMAYKIIDDEEITIRFGYQGEIVVAMDSFLSDTKTSLYLQALKKVEVNYIEKEKFMEFLVLENSRILGWNEVLSNLILQQIERETDLLIDSPLKRYQRVLERSPRLFQEIPAKYIASYLRMTPETLSRLRKG